MNVHELAEFIAEELISQGNEIDDLGDCESVVLMGELPVINLVQLAEKIIRGFVRAKPSEE